MRGPINIGSSQQPSGIPKTWNPPCPAGEHYLKVLERVNGADCSSDEDDLGPASAAPARIQNASTKLIAAAKQENCQLLEQLLDANAAVDTRDANGGTALSWSAKLGDCRAIALLIDRRATVDAVDSMGWSPLMEAASVAEPDAVSMLLAAGASPRLENRSLESALFHAREAKSRKCVEMLRAAMSDEEVLIDAAKSGDAHHLSNMLSMGGHESIVSADNALRRQRHHRERSSLLHWASCNGHVACIGLLLKHGACADGASNVDGWTPLMAAVTSHQVGTVDMLCRARANLALRDSNGRSALMHATKLTGSPECAALLKAAAEEAATSTLQRGARPSSTNANNEVILVDPTRPSSAAGRVRRALSGAVRQLSPILSPFGRGETQNVPSR